MSKMYPTTNEVDKNIDGLKTYIHIESERAEDEPDFIRKTSKLKPFSWILEKIEANTNFSKKKKTS